MTDSPPLTILEEFLLLALDDERGGFYDLPRSAFDCGTACAVAMDLMRLRRVDCDLRQLMVISTEPVGDDILDPVLQALALEPVRSTRSIVDELRFLSEEGEALRERALHRMEERGILRRINGKILWALGSRRYPPVLGKSTAEARQRVLNVILADGIPETNDIMLVAVADACGLFDQLLTPHELTYAAPRIVEVARMDLLARAAASAIADIEGAMAMSGAVR